MYYALTTSKTTICLPAPEKFSIKTRCGRKIVKKVEDFAREGRLKNMKTCGSCAKRAEESQPDPVTNTSNAAVKDELL